jgi:UDP-N-acetylmuramoylalanine-D-glutamate ligase
MYKVIRIVNTYACKKAISSSKNIIAVTITQGKTARTTMIVPEFRRAQEKPIRIFKSA